MRKPSEQKKGYLKKREKNVPTFIPVSKLDGDTTTHVHRHWTVTRKLFRELNGSGAQAHQAQRVLGGSRRDKHVETRCIKSGIRGAVMSGNSFFKMFFLLQRFRLQTMKSYVIDGRKRIYTVAHTSPH